MWPQNIRKLDPYGDIRQIGILIISAVLYFTSVYVDYDHRTGWKLQDHPYFGNTVQVTQAQALSMIRERRIKAYGVRRGRVVMRSEPGKWYLLDCRNNHDIIRKLAQHADYIPYYDDDMLGYLLPPSAPPGKSVSHR